MAFHSFNLNLPLQNNEQIFFFDLNKSPTRESTSSENGSSVPIHEESLYSPFSGFLLSK